MTNQSQPRTPLNTETGHTGRVQIISWEGFDALWQDPQSGLDWDCLFVTPPWIDAWSRTLAPRRGQVLAVTDPNSRIIGLAPLIGQSEGMRVWGDPEVCDMLDLVYAPGQAASVLADLIGYLKAQGVGQLTLGPVTADAATLAVGPGVARQLGAGLHLQEDSPLYAMALPDSWEAYLARLSGKQRHEIRRKLRRLEEQGIVDFEIHEAPGDVARHMETYLALFRANRPDKQVFMGPAMATYFACLCMNLAKSGRTRLGFLKLDGRAVATTLCFDDGQTVYLYNNGYDGRFAHLAVGQLCKVMSIRDSIGRGRRRYNFLKGGEAYKRHLGGTPHPLVRLTLDLR